MFDLDDTLVDTSKTIRKRLKVAANKFSLEENVSSLYGLVANPLRKKIYANKFATVKIFAFHFWSFGTTVLGESFIKLWLVFQIGCSLLIIFTI
jgi:phosphoglycolate phosphatase-like HAD superfamily hydrolase